MENKQSMMTKGVFIALFGDYEEMFAKFNVKITILRNEINAKLKAYNEAGIELYQGKEAVEALLDGLNNMHVKSLASEMAVNEALQVVHPTDVVLPIIQKFEAGE